MDCISCKDHLSPFMDDDLEQTVAEQVREHLSACDDCALALEEIAAVLAACHESDPADASPPNADAMWLRISNVIDADIAEQERRRLAERTPPKRSWNFTFLQLASGFAAVVVISSLLTIVAIRNYLQPTGDDIYTRTKTEQTTIEKLLGRVGLIDSPEAARERQVREQQAAIDYWDQRVALRRSQWDKRTREAFDRNMQVIEQSLVQYRSNLKENPEDEISAEMLDAVMRDKMNLLRDFSDL
ncbi:MAG: zf-HC2 domain-containing protein [Acidobacteria bacterium]|nr:zf-HC2 domain-containing protein [Acidobacteriota bacterium]